MIAGECRARFLPWLYIASLAAGVAALIAPPLRAQPIVIERQGSFFSGGTTLGDAGTGRLSCDHGFVEYQIPAGARSTALLLWHSSSVAVWQNRWDGGEGFQSIFLRRGYPVYLWDGPRVGRANWGCDSYTYSPVLGRDEGNFTAWRLGPRFPDWFPGVQFPVDDPDAWDQATRARYDEFDTVENALLQAAAAAEAIDRIGPTVLVTSSAGGLRALLASLKTDNVRGIVAYESPGYVFPEGEGPPAGSGPFGPIKVPLDEFKRLTRFPIQIVFGDNIAQSRNWSAAYELCRQFVDLVNAHGGKAEILSLPAIGLEGNTHIPFADLNNIAVADQLSAFLERNNLSGR
jgi:hypothetical protein